MTMRTKSVMTLNSGNTGAYINGVLSVLGFVLLANANAVFSGRLLQSLPPFTFLFWAFLGTYCFYTLREVSVHGRAAFALGKASWGTLVGINLTSAFNWIGYFVALKYLEPAIVAAIMCGFGPISVVVLERIVRKSALPAYCYVAAFGTIVGAGLLVWASFAGLTGITQAVTSDVAIGVGAALAGGVSQALTTIVIKQLGDSGWKASRIMVHRFYLLIVLTAAAAFYGPGFSVGASSQIGWLAFATTMGVIIPLWLLQRGILLSDPFTTSVLLALGPVLTYLFQLLDSRLVSSTVSAIGCFTVMLFVVYSTWMKTRVAAARIS